MNLIYVYPREKRASDFTDRLLGDRPAATLNENKAKYVFITVKISNTIVKV